MEDSKLLAYSFLGIKEKNNLHATSQSMFAWLAQGIFIVASIYIVFVYCAVIVRSGFVDYLLW